METTEYAIECRGITKTFASVVANDGIDLTVRSISDCVNILHKGKYIDTVNTTQTGKKAH